MDQYPPLSERVVRATTDLAIVYPEPSLFGRCDYKRWSDETMALAMDAVLVNGVSVRRAAQEYNVPKSTLADRISGRVVPGAVSGPGKYLTDLEEEELVCFLLECASIGYPRSRQEVIAIVQHLCEKRGIWKVVTHGWWESFCRRHRTLALRVTAPLSLSRAKASDISVINKYFDMLEATLLEYELHDKPCQIFNIDETGMPLDPKPLKLVCRVGTQNPVAVSSGKKSHITVVGCVSASGYCIPPMVIYGQRKTLSREMVKDEIPGTIYGLSHKGWMDQELFDNWFNHFLQYAPPARPLLLFMDGHSSHYCPSTIRCASKHEVILFALPSNTTHLTQPLDRGVFGPLKVEWRKVCHEYIVENPGKVVTHLQFSELFAQAWMRSMTMKNILAAFRTCGVYPIDRSKVIAHIEPHSDPKPKAGGLTYLPLLSPTPCRRSSKKVVPTFSDAEFELHFERFEKGYRGSDERYKMWLHMYYPNSIRVGDREGISLDDSFFHTPVKKAKPTNTAVALAKPASTIGKLFVCPPPPSEIPTLKPKQSSRVLTSSESLRLLCEKEQKKEATQRKKEERLKRLQEKRSSSARLGRKAAARIGAATTVLDHGDQNTDSSGSTRNSTSLAIKSRAGANHCSKSIAGRTQASSQAVAAKTTGPVKVSGNSLVASVGESPLNLPSQILTRSKNSASLGCKAAAGIGAATTVLDHGDQNTDSSGPVKVSGDSLVASIGESPLNLPSRIPIGSKNETVDCSLFSPTSSPPLVWINSLSLFEQDELTLMSGGWLSANHMSAVNQLLRETFPDQEGLNDTSILFDKLFWPSKPNSFVQIIHVSGNHWACLSNVFCKSGVDLYDSLQTIPTENGMVCRQACAILHSSKSTVTVNVINVQVQAGGADCGLFAIAMAIDLCYGIDPFLRDYQQERMRDHLRSCLNNRKLVCFPVAEGGSSRLKRVVTRVTTEVHCTCRLPEKEPMACCDHCSTWYHQCCVRIPNVVFDNEDLLWMCDNCLKRNEQKKDLSLTPESTSPLWNSSSLYCSKSIPRTRTSSQAVSTMTTGPVKVLGDSLVASAGESPLSLPSRILTRSKNGARLSHKAAARIGAATTVLDHGDQNTDSSGSTRNSTSSAIKSRVGANHCSKSIAGRTRASSQAVAAKTTGPVKVSGNSLVASVGESPLSLPSQILTRSSARLGRKAAARIGAATTVLDHGDQNTDSSGSTRNSTSLAIKSRAGANHCSKSIAGRTRASSQAVAAKTTGPVKVSPIKDSLVASVGESPLSLTSRMTRSKKAAATKPKSG